jgi:predicted solute-binding protein
MWARAVLICLAGYVFARSRCRRGSPAKRRQIQSFEQALSAFEFAERLFQNKQVHGESATLSTRQYLDNTLLTLRRLERAHSERTSTTAGERRRLFSFLLMISLQQTRAHCHP